MTTDASRELADRLSKAVMDLSHVPLSIRHEVVRAIVRAYDAAQPTRTWNPSTGASPTGPTPSAQECDLADLTFRQFSETNRKRCESADGFNHRLSSWSTSDWFTAVLGELGEAANMAKKLNRVRDGIPGNKETIEMLRRNLRNELGDTFVYLDLLCQSLGFNIGKAASHVFNAKSLELNCPIEMRLAQRTDAADAIVAALPVQELPMTAGGKTTWQKFVALEDVRRALRRTGEGSGK